MMIVGVYILVFAYLTVVTLRLINEEKFLRYNEGRKRRRA